MVAKFDLNDYNVVVVIGTGAGGGVLSNELAKAGPTRFLGILTVILSDAFFLDFVFTSKSGSSFSLSSSSMEISS